MALMCSLLSAGCTSIPSKLPELLERTASTIDNQASWVASEWEASIATGNSGGKLLDIIQPFIASVDATKLDADGKNRVTKFLQGYVPVRKQLDDAAAQKDAPFGAKSNFSQLSKSIRLANSYLEKSVDENKRVDGVIEGLSTIRNTIKSKGE